MKKVMVRAWEIAKEAVKKFGGKVKEFFAMALTMAWEEVKEGSLVASMVSNRAKELQESLNITLELAEKLEAVEKAVQEYYGEDDKLTFRVWRDIRVYFDCPFRSSYQNKKGNYYDIESGKLVDRYVRGTF